MRGECSRNRNRDAADLMTSSVYFSVTTPEAGRASRFCELLGQAAELVRQILLA